MNNPNNIKIKITQENIEHLEAKLQALIHEFSTISMNNSSLEGQQKKLLQTYHHLQQKIDNIPVSDEDFDQQIKQLEEQLASETLVEKELNTTLTVKHNTLRNRSLIKELYQTMSNTLHQETTVHLEKLEAKNAENTALLAQIKENEVEYQELVRENHDLELKNLEILQTLSIQEPHIHQNFQLQTMESFLNLEPIKLESILKTSTQLELFYALSLRLGIIYDLIKQNQKAFKYLSYLPSSLLEWYQVQEIYEKNKRMLLTQHLLPYSSRLLFNRALQASDELEREIFLILSIQTSIEHKEVNQPPYISLLQFYLDQQLWLHAYLMIEKIRNLEVRPAKSCLPVERIIEAFSRNNITHPEQMYPIMTLIPELQHIKVPKEIQRRHQTLIDSSPFLALWCQYQQGVELMKAGEIMQAQAQFHAVLSQEPHFIEAYLKLSELNKEPIWQHITIRKS